MNGQRATDGNMWCPEFVIELRWFNTMATVNEQKRQ